MRPLPTAPSRSEQVYTALRDSIRDCTLAPGTALVQEDIANMLGVSRQPVQQAMALLKSDGLVVERGGRGLYVAPIDATRMAHHYQVRRVLDQLAAGLVASRAARDSAFCGEVAQRCTAIRAAGDAALKADNPAEAVAHDADFHALLYELSGNPLIGPTAEMHWNFLRRVMVGVLTHASRGPVVWDQHRQIVDAVLAGDPDAAAELAAEHVIGAEKALLAADREGSLVDRTNRTGG